jgi:hypothetical protein
MHTTATTPHTVRETESTPRPPGSGGLGWLASGAGLAALTGATFLPPVISLPLTAVAAAVGLAALGLTFTGRPGPGVGHSVAGLVTALVGLLLAATFALLPEYDLALVGTDPAEQPPVVVPPGPGPDPGGTPEVVVLQPIGVDASGTAPDSVDGAGDPVTFAAGNVVDGDPTTAWRIPGDGVGHYLVLTFDRPVHVDSIAMIPGYAKVDPADGTDRFPQNRRVSAANFGFSDGAVLSFEFADDRQFQIAPIGVDTTEVIMEIVATTTAERDFTAVSEIEVSGWVVG